jgi:trimethylamine--corrinoid protein Co-methyltransferase
VNLISTLTDSQIEEIRDKTADILETVGLRVEHADLLRRCQEAGAGVDPASGIVRFPRPLLAELLAGVPVEYTVTGADGAEYTIGREHQHCHAIVTDPWIVDYETQAPRRPRLDDLRLHTALAQELEQVAFVSLMDFPVTDVEGPTSSLRAFEEHVLGHAKHTWVFATDLARYRHFLEVGKIVAAAQGKELDGSRLMSVAVGVLSPMVVTGLNVEFLLQACAHDFPVIPTVCPMAGMSSPYSLAGTLLLGNVELIGLAALTQIVRRGHPYLYAFGPSAADMRSGHDLYYTLDKVLWKIAGAQLGKSYNMPIAVEAGGSMTFRYDQQNGAEGILFMLAALGAGANTINGIGSTYNAIGMSAEMMVIHTAWLEAARFLQRGIRFDERRLGLESIRRTGPGGSYLTDDLTLYCLRQREFWANPLFDHAGGAEVGEPLLARAHEQVKRLTAGVESPLPEEAQEAIRRYCAEQYRKAASPG